MYKIFIFKNKHFAVVSVGNENKQEQMISD